MEYNNLNENNAIIDLSPSDSAPGCYGTYIKIIQTVPSPMTSCVFLK